MWHWRKMLAVATVETHPNVRLHSYMPVQVKGKRGVYAPFTHWEVRTCCDYQAERGLISALAD